MKRGERRFGGGLSRIADVREPDQVDVALARTVQTLAVPTILANDALACSSRRCSTPPSAAGKR